MNPHLSLIEECSEVLKPLIQARYDHGLDSYGQTLSLESTLASTSEKPTLTALINETLEEIIDAMAYLRLAEQLGGSFGSEITLLDILASGLVEKQMALSDNNGKLNQTQ